MTVALFHELQMRSTTQEDIPLCRAQRGLSFVRLRKTQTNNESFLLLFPSLSNQ